MENPFDALALCGEIAIAVLGFSGIVLVFRKIPESPSDRALFTIRLRMIFTASLLPLGVVALAFILDAAAVDAVSVWRTCSIYWAALASVTAFFNLRNAAREESGNGGLSIPRFSSVWKGGALALAIAVVVILLQILNASALGQFWPVLVAVWWGIALAVFSFVGLVAVGREST